MKGIAPLLQPYPTNSQHRSVTNGYHGRLLQKQIPRVQRQNNDHDMIR